MPSARDTSRLIAQSWSQQPPEVKAAYQSRAGQAHSRPPSHSPPSRYSPGSGQRVPFANSCQNTPEGTPPGHVAVSYDPSGGAHSLFQSSASVESYMSFDPASWQLDAGPPSGPINVSMGSYQYDAAASTPSAVQSGNNYPFGYQGQDLSTLATQITAYNIPYHNVQLVASNAAASTSAQFSAGQAVHHAASNAHGIPGAAGSSSIYQYLVTLSAPQVQALRAYVQQYIASSAESQWTHNSRG